MIAHEAIHNVFTLVDPLYLTLKGFQCDLNEKNSLGMDNFRLMFALGFWKKLVYTMSIQSSLDLCYKFNDLYNFETLLDKLPDDLDLKKHAGGLYEAMRLMLPLKLAGQIIQKHFYGYSLNHLNSIENFRNIIHEIESDLAMHQLSEKPHVKDFMALVKFIQVPIFSTDKRKDIKLNESVMDINRINAS